MRPKPKTLQIPLVEARKLTWLAFCQRALSERGQPVPDDAVECIRTATSHIAGVAPIQSVVNASILQGFADERDSTDGWIRVVAMPNHLRGQLAIVDEPPRLSQIPRGGTAPVANFELSSEGWKLAKFGSQFALTEEDLLDGKPLGMDLVAYEQLGRAARRLVPDLVYSTLLANAVLADGTPLFDASRGNLATAALADTALDTGIGAVVNQTLADEDEYPVHRGLSPRFLIVPGQLVGLARRLVRNMASDEQGLIVRGESRLCAVGVLDPRAPETLRNGSATNWMLACPKEQAAGVLIGALDGNLTPHIRTFELDQGEWGLGFDVSLSLACAALDAQALYWSTGAA